MAGVEVAGGFDEPEHDEEPEEEPDDGEEAEAGAAPETGGPEEGEEQDGEAGVTEGFADFVHDPLGGGGIWLGAEGVWRRWLGGRGIGHEGVQGGEGEGFFVGEGADGEHVGEGGDEGGCEEDGEGDGEGGK